MLHLVLEMYLVWEEDAQSCLCFRQMSWLLDAAAVSLLLWRLEIVWCEKPEFACVVRSFSTSSLSLSISHTVVLPLSSLHPLSAWSAGPAGGVSECCEWVGMVDWTAILRCEHHSSWIRRVLRHPAWMALSSSPRFRRNGKGLLKIRIWILLRGFSGFDHLKRWIIGVMQAPRAGFRGCSLN